MSVIPVAKVLVSVVLEAELSPSPPLPPPHADAATRTTNAAAARETRRVKIMSSINRRLAAATTARTDASTRIQALGGGLRAEPAHEDVDEVVQEQVVLRTLVVDVTLVEQLGVMPVMHGITGIT
jgi:hypothetical protein